MLVLKKIFSSKLQGMDFSDKCLDIKHDPSHLRQMQNTVKKFLHYKL